jgi:predicted naringenin-chalcone synthase
MTRTTSRPTKALFAVIAAAAILPARAEAQAACGLRAHVVEHLATRYGESLRGMGLAADNRILEIFASDDTGTWTIAVTSPSGVTCLIASGRHYEAVDPAPAGEPT